VLDVCFGGDENDGYTAGLDWAVKRINLATGEDTTLSSHGAGVRAVAYSPGLDLVVSVGWDATMHVHALSKPGAPPAVIQLARKPYCLSLTSKTAVVAMAAREIEIFDLKTLEKLAMGGGNSSAVQKVEPLQRRESSLKFMTRSLVCMPSDLGFASGSIEGRVSVDWFDDEQDGKSKKYAFKCHRETVDGIDVIYPVNALAFHTVQRSTFASGGGDGIVALWDGLTKRRIRQLQKFPSSISSLEFSPNGRYLAVGYGPGFEDGKEDTSGPKGVLIRELADSDVRGKGAK
jgi:cell cycle arrest protein BUB3